MERLDLGKILNRRLELSSRGLVAREVVRCCG
uniref:Uncharacterized protein n=1 Tax=Globisporangium ultimum (strain ATCC 200006 / CBS 805.95 / DAOM BR144) TaxID=431595 RepID=K3WET2_GLOUD